MNREAQGTLLALLGMILYGLEPVIIKSNPSNPLSFAAFSALFASIFLWIFVLLAGNWRDLEENPAHIPKTFLIGLFGTALAYLSYSYGARLSTAINASLITRAEVLFSFALSYVLLKERITKKQAIYSLLVLLGLILVITQGRIITPKRGDVLLLMVPLFWQIGHVIAKNLPYNPYLIATMRNTFGGLLLFMFALSSGLEFHPLSIAEGIIIAVGQVVWYLSIKRINLSKATAIITPAPAVAIGLSILLGERFTLYHAAGFVLMTLGTLEITKIKSERRV
ncbi:MAG: DMT family transporter [Palaeococcus sp.]|uniref:DMT family transporter n=1 Tax=Palaeococcus sp. (in: euryarchaeotes) TaxID=2820298 RepID=UPI0025EC6FE0|nr:DMT family transporter [Palaeococcus sp. (in: euryarchaeotes)]MCD6558563.1 DMT family transporter [Palaeococcus sp. (in: euryarchaeotes)]